MLGQLRDGSRSVIWFSDDAESWVSVLEVENGQHTLGIRSLTADGTGVAAVGVVEAEDGSYDGGAWTSEDGRVWERVGENDAALTAGEVQLVTVIGHEGRLLVTGIVGTEEQRETCEGILGMSASLQPLPPPAPGGEGISCMSGVEAVWLSEGGDWQLVQPADALHPIEYRAVTTSEAGFLLLGETSAPASPDTMLFVSPDGLRWIVLSDEAALQGDVATALAVRGTEVLAITDRWDGVSSSIRVWRGDAH
jgi:hypothetical protein